ncbi:MAG: hypothetical protein PHX18_02195 [Candidatus Gastranaerophilales bacterium]|nr:hypothetical protein [Candidatus Gastranaerophilales bacterium]
MQPVNLINKLPYTTKLITKFLIKQEAGSNLSNTRFAQDTLTNLAPKAIFARSRADLAETSFLELTESFLVYYCPKILGENVFRKIYSKKLAQNLKPLVSTPYTELVKTTSKENADKIMPVKAAIALGAMAIPLLEYSLTFAKNLFTLKLFKQGDFNNIANLNKDKTETEQRQKKVKNSAIKNIAGAAAVFGGCLATSLLLVKKGQNSKVLKHIGEFILAPGNKLFAGSPKKAAFVNKYFSLDFAERNGKLALSNGQLTACVLIGGAGYFKSAKDRGKQNFLETLFRFPLVGFYVITGSELLEKGFKTLLKNKEGFKNLIAKDLSVPKFADLGEIAKNLAAKNKTCINDEFKTLCKNKILITSVPFLFSIGVMGLFVSGVSRFFTKFRYDKEEAAKRLKAGESHSERQLPDVYKNFM